MTVQKISTWIPVSDEDMLDFGLADGPLLAEIRARVEARRAEQDRRWRALPWYVRAERNFRFWRWSVQDKAMRRLHAALFPDHDE